MKKQVYLQVKKSAIEEMLKRFEDVETLSCSSRARLEGQRFVLTQILNFGKEVEL